MCGIAGFLSTDQSRSRTVNDDIANRMNQAIAHRGPDAAGIWCDPEAGIWLAHRRLSIVDLSDAGSQPMVSGCGRYVLVYNGEIYNAGEHRPALEGAGFRFRGHSDTEVLLNACIHWGLQPALERLNGMFALALWDRRNRVLTLARDRLGKKPLYYAPTAGGFIFGSELRALMQHPDCPRDFDPRSVAGLLRFAYIPAPHSIFSGVHKLEPAHCMTVEAISLRTRSHPYWSLADAVSNGATSPVGGSAEDVASTVHELLKDCVTSRLMSDVPLGAFLSGGIDSSLVTALMQQASSDPVRTFSIGYADKEYDESGHADLIAKYLGTDHTSLMVQPSDCLDVIPELPAIFDEPFADASQVPTFLVSRLARQDVKVCLSGDGGDEGFFGYNRHVAAHGILGNLQRLPSGLRQTMSRIIKSMPPDTWQSLLKPLPSRLQPRMAGEKLHKLASVMELTPEQQYKRLSSQWWTPLDAVSTEAEYDSVMDESVPGALHGDAAAQMRYLDLATYLPGDILTKVDRASMAVGLEARAPLLDYRLIELSWRIPTSIHLASGQGKWILRHILEQYVPRNLFERPKMGFGIPIGGWLRSELRDWAEDLLSERSLNETGILKAKPIRDIWQQHLDGATNAQYQLWSVLMFQAWQRQYIGYSIAGSASSPATAMI